MDNEKKIGDELGDAVGEAGNTLKNTAEKLYEASQNSKNNSGTHNPDYGNIGAEATNEETATMGGINSVTSNNGIPIGGDAVANGGSAFVNGGSAVTSGGGAASGGAAASGGSAAASGGSAAASGGSAAASGGSAVASGGTAAAGGGAVAGGTSAAGTIAGTTAAGGSVGGGAGAVVGAGVGVLVALKDKILMIVCTGAFFVVMFLTIIVELPKLIVNSMTENISNWVNGFLPTTSDTTTSIDETETHKVLLTAISNTLMRNYNNKLDEIDALFQSSDYNYDYCVDNFENQANGISDDDCIYLLAAFWFLSQDDETISVKTLLDKINETTDLFEFESTEKEIQLPVTYITYEEVIVTEVTDTEELTTEEKTYFIPAEEVTTEEEIVIKVYKSVEIDVPVYDDDNNITGTKKETYFVPEREETLSPQTIKYLESTLYSYDKEYAINKLFGVNINDKCDDESIIDENINGYAEMFKLSFALVLDDSESTTEEG